MTGQQLRTIFFLEKYKMMPCLPLKTGTTNWQRSLISLLYVDDQGTPQLDPNDVVKVLFIDTNLDRKLVLLRLKLYFRLISTRKYLAILLGTTSFCSSGLESINQNYHAFEKLFENGLKTLAILDS